MIAYFKLGYAYKDIINCLALSHGITMSLITLKRMLRSLQLRRRHPCTEEIVENAVNFIHNELQGSGQMIGYKAMWRRLQNEGIVISSHTVRHLMLHLDEEGVRQRRMRRLRHREYVSPGPNFVWHVDGYDKLKPYGFAIHGAIDGFSRRVMWLEVGVSNNNPRVCVKYFLETIQRIKVLPRVVRCDHGTENVHIRDVQVYFREGYDDDFAGEHSFLQGKSSSNQRIESWWAMLRRKCTTYWMNLFKDMTFCGLLDTGYILHIHALRFCFMDLIADDLIRTAAEWNTHLIQSKKGMEGPRGRPDIMYFQPQVYDTESFGIPYNAEDVFTLLHELERNDCVVDDHDPDFIELVNLLIPNWEIPMDLKSALDLYANIIDSVEAMQ